MMTGIRIGHTRSEPDAVGVQRHRGQADVDIPIKLFVRVPEEVIPLGLSQLCQCYERARGMFTEDQQARFHGHQAPCRNP
jgi:hypothetical protein